MKKHIISLLVAVLLVMSVMGSVTYAANILFPVKSVKTQIEFDRNDYIDLNDEEIFDKKLEEMNISEKYHDLLRREFFNEIVNSVSMSEEKSFYVEQDDASLKKVTEDEFKNRVRLEKEILKAFNEAIKHDEAYTRSIASSPGVQNDINNGTLALTILVVADSDGTFTAMGLFGWETMPSHRDTDAFGISYDSNIADYPQTARGGAEFNYTLTTSAGTQVSTTTGFTESTFDSSSVKKSPDGYAIEFYLPENIFTNDALTTYNHVYTDGIGFVAYEGIVNNSYVSGVKNFATYAHEKISLAGNSLDYSESFVEGFSTNIWGMGLTYDQLTDSLTWTF